MLHFFQPLLKKNFMGSPFVRDIFQPPYMVYVSIIILHSYMLQIHSGPLCAASMYCCSWSSKAVAESSHGSCSVWGSVIQRSCSMSTSDAETQLVSRARLCILAVKISTKDVMTQKFYCRIWLSIKQLICGFLCISRIDCSICPFVFYWST